MGSYPQLDRYLRLEERQDIADGAGGFVETWVPRGNHWASVSARSGGGKTLEFGAASTLSLRITVREAPQGHPARPAPGERFVDGVRIYLIQAVHEADEAPGYLICFAQEEKAL